MSEIRDDGTAARDYGIVGGQDKTPEVIERNTINFTLAFWLAVGLVALAIVLGVM